MEQVFIILLLGKKLDYPRLRDIGSKALVHIFRCDMRVSITPVTLDTVLFP